MMSETNNAAVSDDDYDEVLRSTAAAVDNDVTDYDSGACSSRQVKAAGVIAFVVFCFLSMILFIVIPLSAGESTTRTFYVACESTMWDYAPMGYNVIMNRPFNEEELAIVGKSSSDSIFEKAVYREYEDSEFKERKTVQGHHGIMGPILHAKVNDIVVIHLKNRLQDYPCGIHMHGLRFARVSDGSEYVDVDEEGNPTNVTINPAMIPPGETYIYEYTVPIRAGPGTTGVTSRAWMYHGPLGAEVDNNAGLVGMFVVTAEYAADEDGRPEDVENEVSMLLGTFDERKSPFSDFGPGSEGGRNPLWTTINGYVYGNAPKPFPAPVDKTTRWYIGTAGGSDVTSIHFVGNTVLKMGSYEDVVTVARTQAVAVDMESDNEGLWLLSSTFKALVNSGMQALYTVKKTYSINVGEEE